MRDYGKVHTSFWASQTIATMSEDGRLLALYLMTCPHGNIAGVFRLPDGYIADDIRWDSERVRKGFDELLANGFANRCGTTKWVWIIKHFEWNALDNPNQRKSALKIASQIPSSCAWKSDYMRVCGHLFGASIESKTNPSETLPKPFLNQEQEQEQDTAAAQDSATVVPISTEQQQRKPEAEKIRLGDRNDDDFARLVAQLYATAWKLKTAPPVGMLLGNTICQRARSYPPACNSDWWAWFFETCRDDDFLNGTKNPKFIADLSYLIREDVFARVINAAHLESANG